MARKKGRKYHLLYLFILLVALIIVFPVLKGSRTQAVMLNSTFSFITLTTLGYGDITLQTSLARSFAILEAIGGVLFMGILIGTLVGVFVAYRSRIRYGK